jgi:hypothetical protein
MSGLEQSFYIIGIIFMAVSLLLTIGIITAIFVIRNKVVSLEKAVQSKINAAANIPSKVAEIVGAVKDVADNVSRRK